MGVKYLKKGTKNGGVLYPPKILKFWVSVRPSVSALFPDFNFSSFWLIFFKLCMDIDIWEEWFGIANGLNSFINNRVIALDWCKNVVSWLLSSFWLIFFKLCMDIDIRKEWFGIATGLNAFINNKVMALDWCKNVFFLNIFRTNGWILLKFYICIYMLINTRSMLFLMHVIFRQFLSELWPLIDVRFFFMLNILWINMWILIRFCICIDKM